MEYDDLADEQKKIVDQRIESGYVNSDRVSDDPEIATPSRPETAPKGERWYLSPGQKPMGNPEQYRNIGGATPIEAAPETTRGADGRWRTAFGDKVRVTDGAGNVSWEDPSGNAIETPKSMQMARHGGMSDDPEISRWRNQMAYDRMTLKERKKLHDSRNGALADAVLRGIAQVNSGIGDIVENGGKKYRRVKFSGNDKGGPVAELNQLREQMGKKGRMGAMGVYLEVNDDGSAKIGVKPRVWYMSIGDEGQKTVKELSNLGTIQEQWVKKYLADNPAKEGEKEEDRLRSVRRVAVDRFGGNYAGWDLTPTEREKYDDEQAKLKAQQDQVQQKIDLDKAVKTQQLTMAEKQMDAEQQKQMFDQRIAVTKMFMDAQGQGKLPTLTDFVKGNYLNKEIMSALLAPKPVLDPDGKQKVDETTGEPITEALTPAEIKQRITDFYNSIVGSVGQGAQQTDPDRAAIFSAFGMSPDGRAPQTQAAAGGMTTRQQTLEAKLRERGIDPASLATKANATQTQPPPVTQDNTAQTQDNTAQRSGAAALPPVSQLATQNDATQETRRAEVGAPDDIEHDIEQFRRRWNNVYVQNRRELLSRYKTVQDVAEDVASSLVRSGKIKTGLAGKNGTRRDLTPAEKSQIIYDTRKKFEDAGMGDFWEREVEEFTPENAGRRLSNDAIIDKLFRNWNNRTAPIKFGVAKRG